jgi:UDP-N-acetylglucosamine acyltransferase
MSSIHPTAVVDPSCEIADDARVGPACYIGPNVVIEAGVDLISHVVIPRDTRIGSGTVAHPYAVLGGDPQHAGYKGEPTRLEIGAKTVIRENVTFNRGSPGGGGVTRIGAGGYFMANSHVGHDAILGDNVTAATGVAIGGHARIGDRVFLGGLCAVHQFGRVGSGAIIGGLAAVTRDVIPYGSAWGNHAQLHGLNMVGLKRRGYDKAAIRRLLNAYRAIFEGPGVFADRVAQARRDWADLPEIIEIVDFIQADAKRPLCLPDQ